MRSLIVHVTLPLTLALAACGSAGPSSQLVDARRAYDRARASEAAELAPGRLLDARRALEAAEAEHDDDAGSSREQHLAYLALRRAEIAIAVADIRLAQRNRRHAERAYQRALEQTAADAERRTTVIESELAQERAALAAKSTELALTRAQREAAEARAKAALESLEQIAQVREEERGLVITMTGEVLFRTDESVLLPIARQRLDQVAAALSDVESNSQTVVIEGHTDSRGTASYNRDLSQARAEAVRSYLISRGVPAERLQAQGMGESQPMASNRTADGRANNRRVELIVSPST